MLNNDVFLSLDHFVFKWLKAPRIKERLDHQTAYQIYMFLYVGLYTTSGLKQKNTFSLKIVFRFPYVLHKYF